MKCWEDWRASDGVGWQCCQVCHLRGGHLWCLGHPQVCEASHHIRLFIHSFIVSQWYVVHYVNHSCSSSLNVAIHQPCIRGVLAMQLFLSCDALIIYTMASSVFYCTLHYSSFNVANSFSQLTHVLCSYRTVHSSAMTYSVSKWDRNLHRSSHLLYGEFDTSSLFYNCLGAAYSSWMHRLSRILRRTNNVSNAATSIIGLHLKPIACILHSWLYC